MARVPDHASAKRPARTAHAAEEWDALKRVTTLTVSIWMMPDAVMTR